MDVAERLGQHQIKVLRFSHAEAGAQWWRVADGAGTPVWAKVVDFAADPTGGWHRLRREHDAHVRLRVPGIQVARGWHAWADGGALLLEDNGGTTLSQLLENGPLPPRQALELGLDVALILERLHEIRWLHLGLTPEAVFLNPNTHAVLLGQLRHATALGAGLPGVQLDGTDPVWPAFAPERSGRIDRPIDARTDLYALGALLYRLMAGEWPMRARDVPGWVHAHLAYTPQPLSLRTPAVPGALGILVDRLLEKLPEDRPASAKAVAEEMRRLIREWSMFPASMAGAASEPVWNLQGPLHGRDDALSLLRQAWQDTVEGDGVAAVISGGAGVGKSALAAAFAADVQRQGGGCIRGKFDQFQDRQPFAALTPALEALAGLAGLTEAAGHDPAVIRERREALARHLGEEESLLQLFVPALSQQESSVSRRLPDMSMGDSGERCRAVLSGFLRFCLNQAQPVLWICEDLQWADPASLDALAQWVRADDLHGLMLLFTHRDAEVGESQALDAWLNGLAGLGPRCLQLPLGPLDEADVRAWLAQIMSCPPDAVQRLASLIELKTGGWPLHVRQMLQWMRQRGWLFRHPVTKQWDWNEAGFSQVAAADDVVTLLLEQIGHLPSALQEQLAVAALLGSDFSVAELANVLRREYETVSRGLETLEHQGLVRRLLSDQYVFEHDRIQEAARRLVPQAMRAEFHRRAADFIDTCLSRQDRSKRLFQLASHLSSSLGADESPARVTGFVHVAVETGERARHTSVPAVGLAHLQRAIGLAGEDLWSSQPALACSLFLETQYCALLSGRFDVAEACYDALVARQTPPERLALARQRLMMQKCMDGRYGHATRLGLQALADLGHQLPPDDLDAATYGEATRLYELLGQLRDEEIMAWHFQSTGEDTHADVLGPVVGAFLSATSFSNLPLCGYVGLRFTNHFLNARQLEGLAAPLCVAAYGLLTQTYDYPTVRRLHRIAQTLADRPATSGIDQVIALLGRLTCGMRIEPMLDLLPLARRVFERPERFGQPEMIAYAMNHGLAIRLAQGEALAELEEAADQAIAFVAFSGNRHLNDLFVVFRQMTRAIQGLTQGLTHWNDADFDEESFLTQTEPHGIGHFLFHLFKSMTGLMDGDLDVALVHIQKADELFEYTRGVKGMLYEASLHWVAGTVYPLSLRVGKVSDEARVWGRWEKARRELERWSKGQKDNFGHHVDLLHAVRESVQGDPWTALNRYNRVLEDAASQGRLHIQAVVSQLLGSFCLEQGMTPMAEGALARARRAYAQWGARSLAGVQGGEGVVQSLDVALLMKGLDVIAGELDYDRAVEKLLLVGLECAGAQRGMLLMNPSGGRLRPQAWAHAEGGETRVALSREQTADFSPPSELIHRVLRSGRAQVVEDVGAEAQWAYDAQLSARGVRAMACLPLTARQRVLGVVYLENSLAPLVFPSVQQHVLEIILGQAGTALEAAQLFGQMETQVAERTRQLEAARADAEAATRAKSEFLANMSHEIRTPMNAILGMAELAVRRGTDPVARDYARKIQHAGKNLLDIVNDILDFSKIEAGKLELEAIDFRLDEVLEQIISVVGLRAWERGLTFNFDLDACVADVLVGDPLRLAQVLTNLCGNAVKFTEEGGVVVGVRMHRQRGREVGLHLWVEDTGIGMSEAQQRRVFTHFGQADASTTRRFGGSGLGLAISRRLIEVMGGSIWVESEVGRGSTFHIELVLPLSDMTSDGEWLNPATLFVGRRVLVADTEPVARKLIGQLCQSLGMEVQACGSMVQFQAAMEQSVAAGSRPDVVLMEARMASAIGSDQTGWPDQALRKWTAGGVTLVLMTPYGDDGPLDDVLASSGAARLLLHKPVTCSSLVKVLTQAFGGALAGAGSYDSGADFGWYLPPMRILVAEDNTMNQELVMEVLTRAGADVVLAVDGLDVLDKMQHEGPFDLVLMDCQMPEMDDLEATRRIRADGRWADLPILAMTANVLASDRQAVLEAGMNDHIPKPVVLDRMFETIRHWTRSRPLAMSIPAAPAPAVAQPTGSDDPMPDIPREAFAGLPGLDVDAGFSYCMEAGWMYQRQLRSFLRNRANFENQFRDALQAGDRVLAERLVHTLKGSASTIGANALARAATALDEVCRSHEAVTPAFSGALLDAVVGELAIVVNGLRASALVGTQPSGSHMPA